MTVLVWISAIISALFKLAILAILLLSACAVDTSGLQSFGRSVGGAAGMLAVNMGGCGGLAPVAVDCVTPPHQAEAFMINVGVGEWRAMTKYPAEGAGFTWSDWQPSECTYRLQWYEGRLGTFEGVLYLNGTTNPLTADVRPVLVGQLHLQSGGAPIETWVIFRRD